MAQECLDEEEEDADDAQQGTNTNANTSKTCQVEGDDADEPEADGGGGGRVPPGAHTDGMPTPNPAHITGPKELGPPWRKRWHACDNNLLQR